MSTHRFVQRRGVALLLLLLILNVLIGNHPRTITYAQDPTERRIESEVAKVTRTGVWAQQSATPSSGGSYLYSSGAEADALTLEFTGTAIEVIYVAGPQLGTLAVEVDGTVLRTVITTSEQTAYQQSTRINYLTDEPHTLKVYAQEGGVIAIDAFVIAESVLVTPRPATATPTTTEETIAAMGGSDEGGIQSSTCTPVSTIFRIQRRAGFNPSPSSGLSALSADGRFIVFDSRANNLVLGDNNGAQDIFVYDRQTCVINAVSVNSANLLGNADSFVPAISADGRYVTFASSASNLVGGDTNNSPDIFLHDRTTGLTTSVSAVTETGVAFNPSISADGRYITFQSFPPSSTVSRILVYDRIAATTTHASVASDGGTANDNTNNPDVSADGRYVVFYSAASNLVANDTNNHADIFVRDRQTNTTTRVSVATAGTQANEGSVDPSISADSRYVTYSSLATNLVAGDTNGARDIFVYDRTTNTTTRVSIVSGGGEANNSSFMPKISGDGRYVTFHSGATNLVPTDTNGFADIFVHDRQTNTTSRVSLTVSAGQSDNFSADPEISADGRYVSFRSLAANLVTGDTNAQIDIFVAPVVQPTADTLALFKPTFNQVNLLNTLQDNPAYTAYTAFSAYAPVNNGQWVMGDWNGDGLDTPGVYANGPFYYTDKSSESAPGDWQSLWIGITGTPVSGRFNGTIANDCIGAVQQANSGGQSVFVLYYTCNLTGTATPTISNQWLSAVLPDAGGFTGVHQFGAGDFDGDRVDSIAVRRGPYIAFGNVAPAAGPALFNFAQYIGAPATTDSGIFVVGNWDNDVYDSFGLFYQTGEFFYRNDLLFNSGAYGNQSVGIPFAGPIQAAAWH